MRGTAGLGGKLRKLFARIQKEFDFPKVYNVRCSVVTHAQSFVDEVDLIIHTLPPPRPEVHASGVDMRPDVHPGHVQPPKVHLSQRMEDMETQIHAVDTYSAEKLVVHTRHTTRIGALVRELDGGLPATKVHAPEWEAVPPKPKRVPTTIFTEAKGTRGEAARFPYQLRITPMDRMPMKLRIRYRASVLKLLNLKPNQIKMVGIVPNLPSAPVKLLEVIEDSLDGYPRASVVQTGRFNSFMGQRVWVIIQLIGKPDFLTVTLKEE